MPRRALSPPDLRTQSGRLRWARDRAGYTSARGAAEAFGWPENTYKSHEYGVRGGEGIKIDTLKKYARAFGVSVAWLATGVGDPLRPDLSTDELELARRVIGALKDQ